MLQITELISKLGLRIRERHNSDHDNHTCEHFLKKIPWQNISVANGCASHHHPIESRHIDEKDGFILETGFLKPATIVD